MKNNCRYDKNKWQSCLSYFGVVLERAIKKPARLA